MQKVSKLVAAGTLDFIKIYTDKEGVYLEESCASEKIDEIQALLSKKGASELASEFCPFLALTNGVQIENAVLYSDEELLDRLDDSNYLEIGHAGNMDAFIYNEVTKKYNITNFYHKDEVFESFESLSALINRILEVQGVK